MAAHGEVQIYHRGSPTSEFASREPQSWTYSIMKDTVADSPFANPPSFHASSESPFGPSSVPRTIADEIDINFSSATEGIFRFGSPRLPQSESGASSIPATMTPAILAPNTTIDSESLHSLNMSTAASPKTPLRPPRHALVSDEAESDDDHSFPRTEWKNSDHNSLLRPNTEQQYGTNMGQETRILTHTSRQTSPFDNSPRQTSSPYTFAKLYNASPAPERSRERLVTSPHAAQGIISELNRGISSLNINSNNDNASSSYQPATTFFQNSGQRGGSSSSERASHQPTAPQGYDVRNERPPSQPYFDPKFQEALKKGKAISKLIEDTLRPCELARDKSSQVYQLKKTAKELQKFNAPAVCKIGIVGDSGVGKSTLINSLLDEEGLAKTSGMGSACTSVVTEYRHSQSHHTSPYTVEIDCMTDDEINDQLQELLRSYRKLYLCDLDETDATADEIRELRNQSNLAWDTLQAAFGSHQLLTKEYLIDSSPGAEQRIQEQLHTWILSLDWPLGARDGTWSGAVNSIQECTRKTKEFLRRNIWPFIKIVRIFLRSQILKSGAVLADMPGLHDSNNARVRTAENYMFDCDEIFIVADINRVVTNKNVDMILTKSYSRTINRGRPCQGISLVCTKSEDLDIDDIMDTLEQEGQPLDTNRIDILDHQIRDADANYDRCGALRSRDEAQDEKDFILMTARNKYITNIAMNTYAPLFPNRSLTVFCVSGRDYNRNRSRVRPHDLRIQGSGIPSLRNHCHKIPAQAQFRLASHFLQVRVEDLVQRVQLWLVGGSQESLPNHAAVQKLLEQFHNAIRQDIINNISETNTRQIATADHILKSQMQNKHKTWTGLAVDALTRLKREHAGTIGAVCRKYGKHTTVKDGKKIDFNSDLIGPLASDMGQWFEDFEENGHSNLRILNREILAHIESLRSKVKDFHGAPQFASTLETKSRDIDFVITYVRHQFSNVVAHLKRDTTQTNFSSYILLEMIPTYESCAEDMGLKVTKRRLENLERKIGSKISPTLFPAIQKRLSTAYLVSISKITTELTANMIAIMDQISSDLDMVRGTEARLLAHNGNFLETLEKAMKNVETDMKRVKQLIEAVKANEQ